MRKIKTDIPEDVKDIIEYSRLRKKYPELDKELRSKNWCNQDKITLNQMHRILHVLKEHEKDWG